MMLGWNYCGTHRQIPDRVDSTRNELLVSDHST
jgi:hypothetical protein